ncbi:MAG TPA: gas vesicle protein GvpG [Acidimicrobiales bacterium]|nr:gas vesicle protein GvpG [Acidimicrobiales bacterium]
MNPFSLILGLPTLPVRGVIRLGQVIQEQADRELHDPASVRHQLEEAEAHKRQGRLSEADEARVEQQAVDRMISRSGASDHVIEARHREKDDEHG